ncbi:MAG: PEP-CTERM sorting domain-containing protein [Fimbriimonas sp.]|nr:PEP-CTERM sorting domain-containing protein [Fimbriimonas sp.]
MKNFLLIGSLSLAGFANAQIYSQANLINGAHAAGHNSMIESNETSFGYGAQTTNNNVVADDFTLATDANMTHIRLFAYQTGATAPSITGVNFAIGNAASTTLSAASILSTGWYDVSGQGVYRTSSGDTTSTNRRIQFVDVAFNQTLTAGTYFLSYQMSGTVASGPWVPPNPTSLSVNGKNAVQSTSGGAFAPVVNGTAGGADLPFQAFGQPVPEPSSMAAIGLGIAAILRRRRK